MRALTVNQPSCLALTDARQGRGFQQGISPESCAGTHATCRPGVASGLNLAPVLLVMKFW